MSKNFDQKLKGKLKQNMEFWDEEIDDINRNEIIDRAYKVDKDLIGILIDDKDIRETFFDKIKEYWVFNVNKFVDYIENIKVLSNSYTKFKNIVGLNVNGKYLNERGEVSLVWPFKDCVLEGGMTKEDQKRNEIFFNEILAKDEIDRLFDAKVLTNFKKYTSKGEEKVKDFNRDEKGTIKDNLIIKGNNLLALHSLKKEFAGKVKLIYIDPPYYFQDKKSDDSFAYNSNFKLSTWLTFMKNRLEVARDLLRDDGVIFVQTNSEGHAHLKILMDEVFSDDRFVNEITWKKYGGVKNQASKKLTTQQETILFYSKTAEFEINMVYNPLSEEYVKHEYKYEDESGRKYAKLRGRGYQGGGKTTKIKYLDENPGSPITTLWDEKKLQLNTSAAEKIKDFLGQKPETLMQRIIELSTNKGEIILDYHLGSGTTCAVSHKIGRQYIGIEQLDYGKNDSVIRLKNIIGKNNSEGKLKESIEDFDNSGISKEVNWKGGGEFIYCELLKYNEDAIDKIQDAKDTKTLLKIWDEMCEHYFLNYDVEIKKFNDNKKDLENMKLKQQKDILVEMLNKNQLYVNLSEIEDSQFKVSKEDKELNKKWYVKND
ncbi:site-specific DNA-methyltransferase [archaeon]|jgi:adenine-specific DNA-methyltransferase|nr:site-specific DNA-methyltransferase [archaeon]MBT4021804.1 site-specific DNA-methyltransferase [archaeon]MBT4271781.1 site-specific DNA-methyltransferase [archaeon]MBT4461425.1 site-specific DNA-methyltransferase [archaeon]MBT6772734.1 site-specific DNA-methyltransferase [archaeon]